MVLLIPFHQQYNLKPLTCNYLNTSGPHVYSWSIFRCSKDKLRSPVISGTYVSNVWLSFDSYLTWETDYLLLFSLLIRNRIISISGFKDLSEHSAALYLCGWFLSHVYRQAIETFNKYKFLAKFLGTECEFYDNNELFYIMSWVCNPSHSADKRFSYSKNEYTIVIIYFLVMRKEIFVEITSVKVF